MGLVQKGIPVRKGFRVIVGEGEEVSSIELRQRDIGRIVVKREIPCFNRKREVVSAEESLKCRICGEPYHIKDMADDGRFIHVHPDSGDKSQGLFIDEVDIIPGRNGSCLIAAPKGNGISSDQALIFLQVIARENEFSSIAVEQVKVIARANCCYERGCQNVNEALIVLRKGRKISFRCSRIDSFDEYTVTYDGDEPHVTRVSKERERYAATSNLGALLAEEMKERRGMR